MDRWRERRQVELARCLDSFEEQFRVWEDRTERAPWETHYSQVRAATAHLGVLRDRLRQTLEEDRDDQIELRVLSAWRVWEAFRTRLGQRQEEMFRPGLAAADELAWACRVPVADAFRQAGKPSPKEPPLSFLNGSVSPNALARARPFMAEPVFGESLSRAAERLLDHLPVPLIGLPWHEAFHAPAMVSIAHETGHVVEADFSLTAALDAALESAAPERADDWKRWRAEVFADHFAVRHCGPAFAGLMTDLLAPRVNTTPANSYPPHAVRMELCFVALEEQGLEEDATEMRRQWLDRVGDASGAPDSTLDSDIPAVVESLGNVRIGTTKLAELIAFDGARMDLVSDVASDALAGGWTRSDAGPQVIVAAAWRVFEEDPSSFGRREASEAVCARIVEAGGTGSRRRGIRGLSPSAAVQAGGSAGSNPAAVHAAEAKRFADSWLAERL